MGISDKCTTERGGGGVTWAFKMGSTPMVCPVIVEDLSSPGQMLIEVRRSSVICSVVETSF